MDHALAVRVDRRDHVGQEPEPLLELVRAATARSSDWPATSFIT
jgi:hypothetical protein